ncbi:melatonin receptor type 1B isoform X2 [Passer montanus]|uniref:melatonin receptor type 1B isoform X2 n=1 Tax=Passer montanus TaxID=9160 RepID=UPI00195FA7EC|nr:melatonin receptor type 1B isoform X2 [Passer montanus]
MLENGSLRNCCDPGGRGRLGLAEREAAAAGAPRPAWVVPVLSSVLIFTTVVDILGNLLVILSVFKNRKLRNSVCAGTPRRSVTLPSAPPLRSPRAPSCPPSGIAGRSVAPDEALCGLYGAPEEGNRCHPAAKSVPKAVGRVKEELLKLAQESPTVLCMRGEAAQPALWTPHQSSR